jgi:CobQ-like glutamine amidotransferase family enzyme
MISVYSFHPEHFNNNGDQGNIEVLAVELAARGSGITFTDDLAGADFALVGDASRAAMKHYRDELEAIRVNLVERFSSRKPTLIVGSSYEFFASSLGLSFMRVERKSEFSLDNGFFGYRNSDTDLPLVFRNGLFVGTSLFGPLLAKNPELLLEFLVSFGFDDQLDEKRLEWVGEIRRRAIDG